MLPFPAPSEEVGHIEFPDGGNNLPGAGAAELAQEALDLGLDGDHLHAPDGGDLLDLFVLQQQPHQLPLSGGETVLMKNSRLRSERRRREYSLKRTL